MYSPGKLSDLAKKLKKETLTLYFAARDRRTPWYAKALIAGVVAYALSPIDLIPDFIPVLGYLDDLLLLPLGIYLAFKLTPPAVLADARHRAAGTTDELPSSWIAGIVVVILWIVGMIVVGILLAKLLDTDTQVLIGG